MDHGLAQVFGSGMTLLGVTGHGVRCAIVLHHLWVVYRDIRGTLLEIGHGISASLHQLVDQLVGFGNGALRVVDKVGLHNPPTLREVGARFALDAMPGKQMAIDADLNAGLIGEQEARRRRTEVSQEFADRKPVVSYPDGKENVELVPNDHGGPLGFVPIGSDPLEWTGLPLGQFDAVIAIAPREGEEEVTYEIRIPPAKAPR